MVIGQSLEIIYLVARHRSCTILIGCVIIMMDLVERANRAMFSDAFWANPTANCGSVCVAHTQIPLFMDRSSSGRPVKKATGEVAKNFLPVQPPKSLLEPLKIQNAKNIFEAAICPEPIAVKPLTLLSIPNSGSSWANGYDGNDSAEMRGSHLYASNREIYGEWFNYVKSDGGNLPGGPLAIDMTRNYGPLRLIDHYSGRA